jgi:hypothetical protein
MKERRKRTMKRLLIEELERRALLAGGPEIAMAATGLTDNSVQDFYKSQVGTEIGGPGGVGMLDQNIGPVSQQLVASAVNLSRDASLPAAAEATTGVGQMVITTGANTPGIGSFAMPIAGPSRAGGTGNPKLPVPAPDQARLPTVDPQKAAATDAAIESFDAESQGPVVAEKPAKPKNATGTFRTGRRAWNFDGDPESRAPAHSGAAR